MTCRHATPPLLLGTISSPATTLSQWLAFIQVVPLSTWTAVAVTSRTWNGPCHWLALQLLRQRFLTRTKSPGRWPWSAAVTRHRRDGCSLPAYGWWLQPIWTIYNEMLLVRFKSTSLSGTQRCISLLLVDDIKVFVSFLQFLHHPFPAFSTEQRWPPLGSP